MPDFLPIMVKTTGLSCLVVGGGKIALHKVLIMLKFDATVTVVARQSVKGLKKLAARHLITLRHKRFMVTDLLGKQLVIAATNDRKTNRQVSDWAKRFGMMINCVDDRDLSGFIFPAIHNSGLLTLAVSTQGAFPAVARYIKRQLAFEYGDSYSKYLEQLRRCREWLKTLESDPRQRRIILNKLLRVERESLLAWGEPEFLRWWSDEC